MTPKEKAESLVAVMYDVDFWDDADEPTMQYNHAVKCALRAVEEILEIKKEIWDDFHSEYFDYWQEVKQEINKL